MGDCAPASTPVSRYVGDVDGGLRTRKYASLKVCRRCGWGDCAPASTPVSRYVGDVDGGLRTRKYASLKVCRRCGWGTAHPQVRQSQGM